MKREKHLIFKINVNNKQVRTLLDNESEVDLIDNILACKFEVIIFKLKQSIFYISKTEKNIKLLQKQF